MLIGIGLILCGLALALGSNETHAQGTGTEDATYVGASECSSCHRDLSRNHTSSRHALALQDVSSDKKAIKADFKTGEKERTVTIPGESAARPFTMDDVSYVIGSGRYVERYLYRVGRNKYTVFPAEWNVEKKVWQPYGKAEGWADAAADWTQNCAGCHTTGLDASRGRWTDAGVQCESCHGPGSVHIETATKAGSSPAARDLKEIRDSIVNSPDAQICGQCHSQGQEPDSKLPYSTKYRPGEKLSDPDVFTLVAPASVDHWWATGHAKQANMQYNEWLKSGHSKALTTLKTDKDATPACLSCHSADYDWTNRILAAFKAGTRKGDQPQPLLVQTAQNGVTCVSCHNQHVKAEGDTPRDFNLTADPYPLCTSCHRDNDVTKGMHHPVQEMFEGKTMVNEVPGIPSIHFTAKDGPKCNSCHMTRVPTDTFSEASHLMQPVIPGTTLDVTAMKDSCTTCHKDVTVESMAKFIRDAQESTDRRVKALRGVIKDGSPQWVRTALDFIDGDGSKGVHNHRYTSSILNAAEVALGLARDIRPGSPANLPVTNPAECAQCHQRQHQEWINSPHAKASLNDVFRKELATLRQPTYCMGCHASGYDAKTGNYVFEGVVCSNCHYTDNGAKHPPAPIKIASESVSCGQCHSGAHAPTYDEWLVSRHNRAGIDCVDCHYAHTNGLRQGDINTTCGNCHKEAQIDQVHMGDKMTCVDCHMKRQLDSGGVHVVRTGHSMAIDPSTCATCHGNTHLLSTRSNGISPGTSVKVTELQGEVDRLKETVSSNWAMGIAGGAVGMIVVFGLGYLILRRGKLL